MNQQIAILYFGHLVDLLGRDSEYMFLPLTVKNVAQLMQHLTRRGDAWSQVFAHPRPTLKITVNKQFAEPDTPVQPGDEVAFVAFAVV